MQPSRNESALSWGESGLAEAGSVGLEVGGMHKQAWGCREVTDPRARVGGLDTSGGEW